MIPQQTFKLLRFRKEFLLIATFLISLMGIMGWGFNISILTGDFNNYIPIAPLGALSFMFLSSSIFLIFKTDNKLFQFIGKTTILVLFVIVSIVLIEHIFKLKLDIEKVFGNISQPLGNFQKGRLSPVTSLLFILTILSLTFSSSNFRPLKFFSNVIPFLLTGYSFLLMTGYFYNSPFLYTGKVIPVSLPTSLSFFLISLALINLFKINFIPIQFRQHSKISNRLAKAFLPVSLAIVIVHGFIDANIFYTSSNPAVSAFIILLITMLIISVLIYNISKNIGVSIENLEKDKLNIQKEKQIELKRQNEEYYGLYEEFKSISEEARQKNEDLAKSNQRIIESEAQYRSLFENMINGFAHCRMIFDKDQQPLDFVYLNVNNAFEQLTGLKNVIGKPVSEVIPRLKQTDPDIFNIYGKVALTGEPERFEMFVEALKKWFSISVFSPQHEHFVAVFDVITERKIAEEQLIIAKEKAEESDKLKTAFLQNMSHEIRTPMNAIMGFAELLPDSFYDKDKLEHFSNIINKRSADLLEIINEILDVSKIESGMMPVYIETFDINKLFNELSDFFMAYSQKTYKQNIQFYIKSAWDPSYACITDLGKLKQIFINLISNAFKFTKSGKIEAGCKLDSNQKLIFYVSDTGIGIASEKQSIIFERFTQLGENGITTKGGTGLGLAIVKGLINILGGKIWLESQPAKGSTFCFSIPYETTEITNNTTIIPPNH